MGAIRRVARIMSILIFIVALFIAFRKIHTLCNLSLSLTISY